jgi:hypothetical protein
MALPDELGQNPGRMLLKYWLRRLQRRKRKPYRTHYMITSTCILRSPLPDETLFGLSLSFSVNRGTTSKSAGKQGRLSCL